MSGFPVSIVVIADGKGAPRPTEVVALALDELFELAAELLLVLAFVDSIAAPGGGGILITAVPPVPAFAPIGVAVWLLVFVLRTEAPEAISAPGGGGILTPGGRPPIETPLREGSIIGEGTPVPRMKVALPGELEEFD